MSKAFFMFYAIVGSFLSLIIIAWILINAYLYIKNEKKRKLEKNENL